LPEAVIKKKKNSCEGGKKISFSAFLKKNPHCACCRFFKRNAGDGSRTGLPDGMFSKQKFQFGSILGCLAMDEVGKFYGYSVYFTAI
jgi:hypothetical protein